MSACPFCRGSLSATSLGGLEREECEACRGVWFAGGGLARVVGESELEALLRRARGQPGRCRPCQSALEYVPSCPACGEAAPGCPRCGTAPLSVAEVGEVRVEVCTGCPGVGLEAGRLERLQRAAERARDRWLEDFYQGPSARESEEAACAGCGRTLKSAHAFEWEQRLWCGSCAPVGACPVELERNDPRRAPRQRVLLKVESALTWLFSKVLG